VLPLLLAGAAAAQVGPPAAGPAQGWVGRIRCAALPGRTSAPLDAEFALSLIGTLARYERNVRSPGSNAVGTLYFERGQGVVQLDGGLVLEGGAAGQGWSYTARYAGRLVGAAAELRGAQSWDGQPRECVISLRRSGT
jgi:hypothetical protein